MATSINVNKQTVEGFLRTGSSMPFVIPEYQRPYSWRADIEVQTLFDDLWEFARDEGGSERENANYFLGCFVSYKNDNNEQEVIDGQQRLTTLFLLLRAIFTYLKQGETKTAAANNFMDKIKPLLWKANKITGETDFNKPLITSKVVHTDENEVFRGILSSGKADERAKDNYSKNYIKLQKLIQEKAKDNALSIYEFFYAILSQCIVMPIETDTQDTALTIFHTLNDRGMPLSDADIFKAKIYGRLQTREEKDAFIRTWQEMSMDADNIGESMQSLFYYYMFYVRATEKDKNNTTPAARKYFLDEKHPERLYNGNILLNLGVILELWENIKDGKKKAAYAKEWANNSELRKYLDILMSYPNEFWKYPVITYYMTHKDEQDFEYNFAVFLRRLICLLVTRYLVQPSIVAVKNDILTVNVAATDKNNPIPVFTYKQPDYEVLRPYIINPNRNITRILLEILAYNRQDILLPKDWQIEHIFPKHHKDGYITTFSDEKIEEYKEHLGNKITFEWKLNIWAGNNYFGLKRQEYKKSHIAIVKEFTNLPLTDWGLDNVLQRDKIVCEEIIETLKKWSK